MSAIRTLLVEDDDVDALLLEETLALLDDHENLEIERVDRLSSAIERLRTLEVDVVLLDLGLPDSQGLATFLRFHDFAPHLPVVVLTGTEDDLVALAAIEAGAQDYLAKRDLLGLPIPRILRYAMERHRLQTTLQRNMEIAEEQRAKLRALFDKALDAYLLLDAEGRVMDANPAADELAGHGPGGLVGSRLERIALSSSGRPLTLDAIRQGGDTISAMLTVGRPRREIEARVTLDVIPGEHLLALRDVSDQNANRRALEASEARFRELVESAHDGMYRLTFEPELRMDYLSPAIEGLTGFAPDDFRDRASLWEERIHPDDLVSFRNRSVLASGESERIAYRWRHRDGSWRWLEDLRNPVITDGELTGLSAVTRDVSAQRRMDEALHAALDQERRAADKLREVDAMKSTFLQAVSHELRTPLTVIQGFSLTLQKHADQLAPARRADLVDRMVAASQRLERLLTDLLDVDRLDRGLVAVERRQTDIGVLLDGLLPEIDRPEHPLSVDFPPDLIVALDAPKVERIVENLVRNAVKHTPAGTPIAVRVTGDERGIVLTVADKGPGIPPELAATIFEPFTQGHHAAGDASPGTGIGLSLVARFASLHGGTARVEPDPGGGAQFIVELPSRSRDPQDEPSEPDLQRAPLSDDTETSEALAMVLASHAALPTRSSGTPLASPEASTASGASEPAITIRSGRSPDEPVGDRDASELVAWASGQLLHIESPDEAAGIILRVVHRFGGSTVPAARADDHALPLDLSFGTSEPILPTAEPHSVERMLLERHLPGLVESARRAVDTANSLHRFRHDATVDPLTGLANRRGIERVLSRARRGTTLVAFDLDGFKAVNDRHGHAAGDQVLRAFADALRQQTREVDHLGRLGGDEFLAVLPDTDTDSAQRLLQRLRDVWIAIREHDVGFSAGLATVVQADASDTLSRADAALYAVKAAGKDGWKIAEGGRS